MSLYNVHKEKYVRWLINAIIHPLTHIPDDGSKGPEIIQTIVQYKQYNVWPKISVFSWFLINDKTYTQTTYNINLDDWLTMHRSISLVDLQLDAQNSYLFTYNIFIKILYMFRALPCSSSGGLRRNCIYAASGIVTVCKNWVV